MFCIVHPLTLVGAEQEEFFFFLAFTLFSSVTLEVNVSTHEKVRRSQSLQNPSVSAVINWIEVRCGWWLDNQTESDTEAHGRTNEGGIPTIHVRCRKARLRRGSEGSRRKRPDIWHPTQLKRGKHACLASRFK